MHTIVVRRAILFCVFISVFTSFAPRDITWVAIGDSITYLNDHRDETGNRVKEGYMTRVTHKLHHIHYINQGHNGWTAANIAREIEKLDITRADVYTVFLGTNDWWQGRPVGVLADYRDGTGNGTLYGSFRIIIDKLRSLNPQASITLITPMQREDFVYIADGHNNAWGSYRQKNGQSLEQFAEAVKAIGRYEHIAVIDLYHDRRLQLDKLVKFKNVKDPGEGKQEDPYPPEAADMTYDGLHPSDKGNAVIARKLVKVLRRAR